MSAKFKLVFFAPSTSTQAILDHLFLKFPRQLGNIGLYDQCAFITRGTGQFRPGPGADPTVGPVGQLGRVEEDRVEIVVNDGSKEIVSETIQELKKVHPYDEVAYDVYKMEDF
ncbi:GTP cyclohydrolase 1 type 2/Nif3 [Desarmillaria tabescens]|uniref:ATP phosphoribosyltransferase n=1 Tax=Armillaria tabescens TaxID=1929756 RepID=A0AA39MXL7_ARMTA|nr:GTP cyclohydrolase 1 type 2/Nif3 [Desarmillaria tabescens]KAK0450392.1 GTP cyclohydrolase 1 type 2/Nif3 [Desarmillaria tabescens]